MKISDRPPAFVFRKNLLHADRVPVPFLAAKFGTPLYVYSASTLRSRFLQFDRAFARIPHTICYSVKANSNLTLLKMLARQGSGFDVVSGGELERVLEAGRNATRRVVFSGVGKTAEEMDTALKARILIFNVESESELELLAARAARQRQKARIALRVNPDVFADTHPYISTGLREHKFGVDINAAREIYARAARFKSLEIAGVSVHIGSQITSVEPFAAAISRVAELVQTLRADGHQISYVDAGGGLAIGYTQEDRRNYDFDARLTAYSRALVQIAKPLKVHLLLEPGRSLVGPAGALIARVLVNKKNGKKQFVIVDAGMNDLVRPSLYGAHHEIVPVSNSSSKIESVDIVGPVCETGDFFARDREISELFEGDLIAILDAGAYGMSLASNYNSRPRPAEVMVDGTKVRLIRRRESMRDLLALEK